MTCRLFPVLLKYFDNTKDMDLCGFQAPTFVKINIPEIYVLARGAGRRYQIPSTRHLQAELP